MIRIILLLVDGSLQSRIGWGLWGDPGDVEAELNLDGRFFGHSIR